MTATASTPPSTPLAALPALSRRQALCIGGGMLAALAASEAMQPTHRLADERGPLNLATDVPSAFGDWQIDQSIVPILPDPSVQAKLDVLYTQILARTYVNSAGGRVMLTIAYGSDQSSEATSVHRPEFCYSAQGFRVSGAQQATVALPAQPLQVVHLTARIGERFEPITYWVTLDQMATLPGWRRKLTQLRYGLNGDIPDGMLVRTSTVGLSEAESFALQSQYLQSLFQAMSPAVRPRYFGQ